MRRRMSLSTLAALMLLACSIVSQQATSAADREDSKRMVLVELYTSQGCNMCPTAEAILGELAGAEPRIVPIAFHVDYFDKPWKDVYSDPLSSQRQMAYNQAYKKPKPAEYGLYYTPMMMVDGEQSVNGRDPATARAAISKALAQKPLVGLDASLALEGESASGTVKIQVTSRSTRVENVPLLVCAVLRDDGVVTEVASGENRGKALVARFPARETKFAFFELKGKASSTHEFPFRIDPAWNRKNLRVAVFVQDKRTGAVHQAADLPWRTPEAR